jgi:hypothetical protein
MANGIEFRVMESENWQGADLDEIICVANNVSEILCDYPVGVIKKVRIEHFHGATKNTADCGPVIHPPNGNGEFCMRLCTGGEAWGQYAYQIAHELGHILENIDITGDNPSGLWILDTINEVSSLLTLDKIFQEWDSDGAPVTNPNWESITVLNYKRRLLTDTKPLGEFLESHKAELKTNNYLLHMTNGLVHEILPLFEKYHPTCWRAVEKLNLDYDSKDTDAERFQKWLALCKEGEEHKFVTELEKLLMPAFI